MRTASPTLSGLLVLALAPAATAAPPATPAPEGPARPSAGGRKSAFDTPVAARLDPYGPRPPSVPKLSREQILRYALQNPAVKAAGEQVEAMRAKLGKAKLAWLPIIDTTLTLAPGVFIECEDVPVDDGTTAGFDFQFCHPDDEADVQTISGYFSQLNKAGVRVQFNVDSFFPVYTFGKIKQAKRAAEAGVAIAKLNKLAVEQETAMRVQQAHAGVLAARESQRILREAKRVVDQAEVRIIEDLGGDPDDFDADPSAVTNPDRDPDDLFKIRHARAELELLMVEALKVESLALAGLWALAGTSAPRGFDVAEDKLGPVEIAGGLKTLAQYKDLARTNRPEAKMAAGMVKVREAQERLARSSFLPDLGVALNIAVARTSAADKSMSTLYYVDNYNFSRVLAALALRWRWDFHFDAFDLKAARAELRAADLQREAAALLLGRDVEQAYGDLVDAQRTREIEVEQTRFSWQLVVSQEQRDTVGGGNAGELVRALERWYKDRFGQVEATFGYNEAVARLSRAVGSPLTAQREARPAQSDGPASKK